MADIHSQLAEAVTNGDSDTIERLLKQHPALLEVRIGVNGETSLHLAAASGRNEVIEQLLALGANVNASVDGLTPLHCAVTTGPVNTVELLLRRGADVNARDSCGETPLLIAALRRPLVDEDDENAVPDLLLKHGAILDAVSAAALRRLSDLENLLKTDQQTIQQSPLSTFVLTLAVRNQQLDLTELLLKYGVDPNGNSPLRNPPLFAAVGTQNANREIVCLLLNHGADPNAKNNLNEPVLVYAKKNGCPADIIDLLQHHGAKT